MKLKGRSLWIRGMKHAVDVEEFTNGDGEGFVSGYYERQDRRFVVDVHAQDDLTLGHEVGHGVADAVGVYMSEDKMPVFEEFVAVCRDPRNAWFLDYLAGTTE